MSNNYKRIVYVGVQIDEKEFLKSIGLDYDEWLDYTGSNKLDLNGHDENIGQFGLIYTDDNFICVGTVIDTESSVAHVDISAMFKAVKFEVTDKLRRHKITIGEVRLYATTLCY